MRPIPEFGEPLPQLILTGGDPLERKDLYELSGGSRARAYEASGDALGEEPFCQYEPHSGGGR